jgi:8-oxo-dGTP pyrophosphatase MutT (NUDIX family)
VSIADQRIDPAGTTTRSVLRCSVILFRLDAVLLLHRSRDGVDDWVLPGGTPRRGESAGGCARRELWEETGLRAAVARVAFVLDSVDHDRDESITDIVFTATEWDRQAEPHGGEPGARPQFVPLTEIGDLHLRPPVGGHLRALHRYGDGQTASYLGNLWRPAPNDDVQPQTSATVRESPA